MKKLMILTLFFGSITGTYSLTSHAQNADARIITDVSQVATLDDAFDLDCAHGLPIFNIVGAAIKLGPMAYVTGTPAKSILQSDRPESTWSIVITERKLFSTTYRKLFVVGAHSLCVTEVLEETCEKNEQVSCLVSLNFSTNLIQLQQQQFQQCQQTQQQRQQQRQQQQRQQRQQQSPQY